MKSRHRGRRGLTFLEVTIASSLLAIIMLAVISQAATTQGAVSESSDQVIAANHARNAMEQLLQADWQRQLLPYYQNYLNRTYGGTTPPNSFPVPIPGEPPIAARDPLNPALPANKLGTIIVREPLAGELPGYDRGGQHMPQAPCLSAIPVPPNPQAPTLLVLIVKVNVPARPGRAPVNIELRSVRSFL